MKDLGHKTEHSLAAVGSKTWLGAFKKVQKQEDLYLSQ